MKTLVVGAGAIARQHLAALARLADVKQVVVCDRSPVTARAMSDRYCLDGWTSDYASALERVKPDVVHVTTPPNSHVELSARALEAGCHVIVEKPASLDRDDLLGLVSLAEAKGLWLVEDYNYLFNPAVIRLFDDLAHGRYGRLVHVDVTLSLDIFGEGSPYLDHALNGSFRQAPTGPVADFLPHLACLALRFVGRHSEVSSVWSKTSVGDAFAVDGFRAVLRGENATASLGFSPIAQPDLFSITVEGTRQRSRTSVFEGRSTREQQYAFARPLIPLANGLREGAASATGSLSALASKLSGGPGAYMGLWALVEKFYESLRSAGSPPVSTSQMLDVADLVNVLGEQAVAQ